MVPLLDVIELSRELCPHPIQGQLAYATIHNFAGQILAGYHPEAKEICLLTPKAASALCEAQNQLLQNHNLSLFIYDAYRPRRAVQFLLHWMKQPVKDEWELTQKLKHYPRVEKSQLVDLHYLSADSNHCYGNTVDVVLCDPHTGIPLDFGTVYDYMDPKSHLNVTSEEIGIVAFDNRKILQAAMIKAGFQPHETEYWHFSHQGREGREVENPLDIEISPALKGVGVR